MITVEEASQIIEAQSMEYGIEEVPLDQAVGRVLRESLYADREFPPYDRVTMDGIAIRFEDFEKGTRHFPIEGIAAAGATQQQLKSANHCLEVMTGAVLPLDTDVVIRYEDLAIQGNQATLQVDAVNYRQNVHKRGSDREQGSLLVSPGQRLSAAEIGVAATVGKASLKVSKLPRVVIISTGDELVQVHEQPLPHQIRRSNVHRLLATLREEGIQADSRHLVDELDSIVAELREILRNYDVVILSGGVSKGKYDYIPQAMADLGVEQLFHKIKQRPGKPFWFGLAPSGARVFALPGNPVSSFMCTCRYFIPWLHQSIGLPKTDRLQAALARPISFKPDLTYFAQIRLHTDAQGQLLATPIEGNGSGDLANLVEADGFLELERGKDQYDQGDVYKFWGYRK